MSNLKWRSKISYTIWGAENFCRAIFCADKYVEKISANLGGLGYTTLLTGHGITHTGHGITHTGQFDLKNLKEVL